VSFSIQLADLAEPRPGIVRERAARSAETRARRECRVQVCSRFAKDYVPQLDSLRPLMPQSWRNRFPLHALNAQAATDIVLRAGGNGSAGVRGRSSAPSRRQAGTQDDV